MGKRLRITIRGAVQGVGFRPFVYRTATANNLAGWVINDPEGVTIEAEGTEEALDRLVNALDHQKPTHAYYESFDVESLEPVGYGHFEIRKSGHQGTKRVLMLPDIATCPECLEETFDPQNRRYLYPFTNCTHCGPRYSIITGLPYDRQQTTMRQFTMCEKCRAEYEDPADSRFHAQPNACPECGPQVEFWDVNGKVLAHRHEAMQRAADAVERGQVVALKGLGGFQLLVDATNETAVSRLRQRKNREEKPLALMMPDLVQARELCLISSEEEELLKSPQAPIVILECGAKPGVAVASSVAPGNPTLGIMLPYTPMHHILMHLIDKPVVATSGNISDEPICTDEDEALERMSGIADCYLVHDRPIERHVDDSVVRLIAGRPTILRRARGYAPLPVSVKIQTETGDVINRDQDLPTILALGGHLKNTIAVNRGTNIFISQHIGDLDTYEATKAYQKVIEDLPHLYELQPDLIVHDKHPEYYTTKDAHNRDLPTHSVQHHYAHILSCMAEHDLEGPLLGVAWDGTGNGTDNTIWGGEFMVADHHSWERVATFRSFHLPGGDKAVREPRRSALGILFELFWDEVFEKKELPTLQAFSDTEIGIIRKMLKQDINSPLTSSAGRLFDAVASLLDIRQKISFEGQAAMALEHLIPESGTEESYPYEIHPSSSHWLIDWAPVIRHILMDLNFTKPAQISNKFHNTLAEIIVEVAERTGKETVILSGGCFQNVYLTEQTIGRLIKHGFRPFWHQRIPPNDGGIAVGQLYHALCNTDELVKKTIHHEIPG